MITITLPDGSTRAVEAGTAVRDIAVEVSPGLAKAALAAIVDDRQVDLSYPVTADEIRDRLMLMRFDQFLSLESLRITPRPTGTLADDSTFGLILDEHYLRWTIRDHGGIGIEALSSSHTAEQWGEFSVLAREFGFDVSRGSDFHGPGESRVELGALPELPLDAASVWRRLQ